MLRNINFKESADCPMSTHSIQHIRTLLDIWGANYLFHPYLQHDALRFDWERKLLRVLPQMKHIGDDAALRALLHAHLSLPVFTDASKFRRVHEGWNEDGLPYVYRQFVENIDGNAVSSSQEPILFDDHSVKAQEDASPRYSDELSFEERLFSVCKLWTVLRYFAPHFPSDEDEQDAILQDWLSRAEATPHIRDATSFLEGIAASLHDRHAWIHADEASLMPPPALSPEQHAVSDLSCFAQTRHIHAVTENVVCMTPFTIPNTVALQQAFALIRDTRGLLIELRGYPQCHFQHEFTRYLCQMPVQSPRYEIPVVRDPSLAQRTWKIVRYLLEPDGRAVYDKPVVALIDETTQSSAEDFCMYLRIAGRVTFVGRSTAGCVGNATYVNLPGKRRFTFTGMRVFWPDDSQIWRRGVEPDVYIEKDTHECNSAEDDVLKQGWNVLQTLMRKRENDACGTP